MGMLKHELQYKRNAFFIEPNTNTILSTSAAVLGGNIHEAVHMDDFVAVSLGLVNRQHDGNGAYETLYWFVPVFRYMEGQGSMSNARPRRFITGDINLASLPLVRYTNLYMTYNTPPVLALTEDGANEQES